MNEKKLDYSLSSAPQDKRWGGVAVTLELPGEQRFSPLVIERDSVRPSAPTHDAVRLLHSPIHDFSRDVGYEQLSQTPLNPNNLFVHNSPYGKLLSIVMEHRLMHRYEASGLPEAYQDVITEEVAEEFERRLTGNAIAYSRLKGRLLGADPSQRRDGSLYIAPKTADILWRALTATADMRDTAKLLLQFPEMGSIEAAKLTSPLDLTGPRRMYAHMANELRLCREDPGLDVEIYDEDQADKMNEREIEFLSRAELDWAATLDADEREIPANRNRLERILRRSLVFGTKTNIAEITHQAITVQLVRKQTSIVIDPKKKLQVPPRLVTIRGSQVNHLPVGTALYWRVIRNGKLAA